jgi:hypothetical protein
LGELVKAFTFPRVNGYSISYNTSGHSKQVARMRTVWITPEGSTDSFDLVFVALDYLPFDDMTIAP